MVRKAEPELHPSAGTPEMYLRQVDTRLNGLKVNHPGSPEIARMKAARDDIFGRMSPAERTAYKRSQNAAKSRDEIEAEAEAERVAMDANRDKPAI